METAGTRLRALRKARKLTHAHLREAIGIPQSTISEIERGESREPSGEWLVKLAEFFDVEPTWILTGKGPKHTVTSKGDGETELLIYYRSLSAEGRSYLLARAKDLHLDEHRQPQTRNGPSDAQSGKRKH